MQFVERILFQKPLLSLSTGHIRPSFFSLSCQPSSNSFRVPLFRINSPHCFSQSLHSHFSPIIPNSTLTSLLFLVYAISFHSVPFHVLLMVRFFFIHSLYTISITFFLFSSSRGCDPHHIASSLRTFYIS